MANANLSRASGAKNPKRIAYPWLLARGDTVILTENDNSDSKIIV